MSLKQLYIALFFIGWFFFPFNDFEGISALGEYKNEAGSYFFLLGFFVMCIDFFKNGRISIPYKSRLFQLLFLFLLWCVLTVLFNFDAVTQSYFKQTTGWNRFVRQYISVLIAMVFFVLLYWNVLRGMTSDEILLRVRKVLLISFAFVSVYGILETAIVVFGVWPLRPVLAIFDYFPFLNVNYPPGNRISSVAYESPSLGNYLIAVSPWMFSYVLTSQSVWRFLPTLLVLFLTFFSGSRTALINIAIQLVLFMWVLYALPKYRPMFKAGVTVSSIVLVFAMLISGPQLLKAFEEKADSLNFSKNLKNNISNQSRFGHQYASLQVFKEHPIVGVGYGQETYYKRHHYPRWAKRGNWEFPIMYENKKVKSFPSAYNMYTRLLSETGIIGAGLFIFFVGSCISMGYRIYRHRLGSEKTLGFILWLSFVGMGMNWLQTDFFRQHAFWLCLVIGVLIIQRSTSQANTQAIQGE